MKKYILLVLGSIALLACKKDLQVADVEFNVTVGTEALVLKDTSKFTFGGNPDIITFWSGEVGKRYEFRGRTEADGTPIMSFRTKKYHAQENTLKLLISTDFIGTSITDPNVSRTNIANANWTDVSQRATLPLGTNYNLTNSGNVDLSEYAAANKPIYFAFKYVGLAGAPFQRWEIDSYNIKNNLADGTSYTIANFNGYNSPFTNYGVTTFSPGFAFVPVNTPLQWFNSTVNNVAGIVFRTDNPGLTAACETWAIIGPINLKKITPDVGTVIKGIAQSTKDVRFNYIYATKGDFNATFIATKNNANQQKLISKTVKMSVK